MEDILAIARKIVSLQRLASNAGTPEEAATALAKAQALLMKYNVGDVDIDAELVRRNNDTGKEYAKTTGTKWKRLLLHHIARYNLCASIYVRHEGMAMVIGSDLNRTVVIQLFHACVNQLSAAQRRERKSYQGTVTARKWSESFYLGAVHMIKQRLKEQQQAMMAAENSCRALVVSNKDELERKITEYCGSTKIANLAPRNVLAFAYQAGKEAGRNVTFDKAIKPGQQQKLLK